LKLIHTVFLGGGSGARVQQRDGEVSWTMSLPMVVLAGLCIVFGVFAFQVPLKCLVSPVLLAMNYQPLSTFAGFFNPMLAVGLLILGLAAGLAIYLMGNVKSARTDMPYVGGEILDEEVMSGITAGHFYDTIKEEPLAYLYRREEAGRLDLYQTTMGGVGNASRFVFERIEQSVDRVYAGLIRAGEYLVRGLRKIHSGILPAYVSWVLVGLVILVFLLMR
jgi:NADH:ubiquinone oxidoreductase subunit 5 (subunit L)/multisubunit Na+/H+ antiporter MnhA subunit